MRSSLNNQFVRTHRPWRVGFTAIEVVIAMSVILVLAGLLLVGIGPWFSQLAKRYDTQTRLGNLRGALEVYRTDVGTDAFMTHALGNTRTWASLRKILETLRPAWATLPRDPRVLPAANQWDLIPPGIKLHYSPNLRTTGLWGDLSRWAVGGFGDGGSVRIIHPVDDRLETWVYWLNRAPSSISGNALGAPDPTLKIASVVRDFVMPPVRASDGRTLFDVYGTTQRYTQLSGANDFETFSGRVSPSPIGETLDNTFDIAPRYPLPVPPDGPAWYRAQWPPLKNVDDPDVGTPIAWPSTTSAAWDTAVDPDDAASIPIWEWPWGQPAIDRATTDLMTRTVGATVQRRSLDHLSPERTFEILACASVVERTAAGRLLRRKTEFLGCSQIVFDGRVKLRFELRHRLAVERDDVVDVLNAPDNDLVFCIKDHAGSVALVGHKVDHGCIPILSTNSRTAIVLSPWSKRTSASLYDKP